MRAMFAQLTTANFYPKSYAKEEQARLYMLADLVWEEVHRTDGPRSETQIHIYLTEMEQILKRKRRRR